MTHEPHRNHNDIKEELFDLRKLLRGLPPELQGSHAYLAYERRAEELSRDLILSKIAAIEDDLPTLDVAYPAQVEPSNIANAPFSDAVRALDRIAEFEKKRLCKHTKVAVCLGIASALSLAMGIILQYSSWDDAALYGSILSLITSSILYIVLWKSKGSDSEKWDYKYFILRKTLEYNNELTNIEVPNATHFYDSTSMALEDVLSKIESNLTKPEF